MDLFTNDFDSWFTSSYLVFLHPTWVFVLGDLLNPHMNDLFSTPACRFLDCLPSTPVRLFHVHMRPHHHPWPYHNRILDFKPPTLTTISYPSSSFALVTTPRNTAISSRLHYLYHFSLFISSLLFSLPSLLSLEKSLLLQLLSSYTFNELACVSPSLSPFTWLANPQL